MGIETIIMMIPKGGKYAKSIVNAIHKAPKNWNQMKNAIRQIEDLLQKGKLRLDGKQRTIFEQNKNILKTHEQAATEKAKYDDITKKMWKDRKEYPPFNTSKEDFTKGWTPTVVERQNLRNVYKKLDPPERLYTKEMEAIDEELDALAFGGEKYEGLSTAAKAKIFQKLQAEMKKLIKVAKENDPTTLSLSQINKKNHDIQKRIREIADNPNIKGTVYEGPKRDMIKVIAEERTPLDEARKVLTKKNSEIKYGNKYPVLDPENDAFIVIGLDELGHPIKMSRFTGKFSATKDKTTGELTSGEGTSFYDKWNSKTGTMRKEGEEVFHETLNREGKVIMSNPEYKLPKTGNMELQTEFYTDLSTSDLVKKGYTLKQVDMIRKGREARKYLEKTENPDHNIRMHEQTSTNEIGDIMEDIYNRGDDVYKMSIEEWVKKIPEYFAGGGHVPGFATGGVSNLFRQRQGFRYGTGIKLVKGARWVIRMLKEIADDMIFGKEQFAKMAEPEKIRLYKETQAAIKHLESGGPIPENLIQSLRQDARFKNLTVSKGGDKDFIEIQEVVLGKPTKGMGEKIIEGKVIEETVPKHRDITKMTKEEKAALLKKYQAENPNIDLSYGKKHSIPGDEEVREAIKRGNAEREYLDKGIAEGAVEQIENIDLMAFKNTLPKDLLDKVNQLPVEKQTNLLRVMKRAFDAAKKGNVDKGVDVLQKQMLTDFIPKGKPHATGGLIDGYATGGVSNLFRQRYRSGKAVELVTKLPEYIKFVELLWIKASNQIRQGLGKWKGLTEAQRTVQHDNMVKKMTEWQKTKKFDKSFNEYFGIDAEKAFIEAQSKVKKNRVANADELDDYIEILDPTGEAGVVEEGMTIKTLDKMVAEHKAYMADMQSQYKSGALDKYVKPEVLEASRLLRQKKIDKVLDKAYDEVFYQKPVSGDYKYDADVLADSIAEQLGKVYDDLPQTHKSEIYNSALNRIQQIQKMKLTSKDLDQKIELQMFDTTGKKGNAEGGLIGYATGGVSNLFRRR